MSRPDPGWPAAMPPAPPAVDTALRYRRLQLAQALLTQLGTRVRHGAFMGLDLGPGLLQRPQPLARALGLAQRAWLDQALQLCQRRSHLLQLGADDGYLACGLLHAGLVARATLQPCSAEAAARIADDAARNGLTDRLHLLPAPGDAAAAADPDLPAALAALADAPHLLCLADHPQRVLALAESGAALPWPRCSVVFPVPQDADAGDALARLRALLGPDAAWQRLDADPAAALPAELDALAPSDRALLLGDEAQPAWWWVQGAQVPARRRTLLCTNSADPYVARLLATLRWDAFEPLDIDVLHYSTGGASDAPAQRAARAARYPAGVRVFELATTPGADGLRVLDPAAPVCDSAGQPITPCGDFFDGYQRFAVWSLEPANARLLQWLCATQGRERVAVLVADNEVDLRWRALQYLDSGNPALQASARQHHPEAMEQTYDAVRHFVVARQPWETMLRHRRGADLVVHPCLLPIKNDLAPTAGVLPPDDAYVLMLHPKPSLPRDEVMAQLQQWLQRWQVDRPLRILTLRNDLATGPLPLADGRGRAELRVFPYPVPERLYFGLLAGCHGLVLVPRGGMTSTRDAVRLGLDIFDDGAGFSPNRVTLRDELGLHVHGAGPITALHGAHVGTPAQRLANQRRLADYERAAVARLRQDFL